MNVNTSSQSPLPSFSVLSLPLKSHFVMLGKYTSNCWLFFKEFMKDPKNMGSMLPSSPWLAKRITALIPPKENNHLPPQRYLEVGPGTGVFTEEIIKKLRPQDHLDLVDNTPSLCEQLKKQFRHLPNVHIHCMDIQNWQPEHPYDAVVSGLPLNNFPPAVVKTILVALKNFVKNNGKLSYFEYWDKFRKVKYAWTWNQNNRRNLKQVFQLTKMFFVTHGIDSQREWLNVLPANVRHCKITHETSSDDRS